MARGSRKMRRAKDQARFLRNGEGLRYLYSTTPAELPDWMGNPEFLPRKAPPLPNRNRLA